jgi:RNA recognition motif-containing protein
MTIYIGNVSHSATAEDLVQLFSQFGEVSNSKIIMDKFTGRSKGFGFVDMDDESANNAINQLNGTEFMTRNVVVNEAKPREEGDRPRRPFNRSGNGGGNGGGNNNRRPGGGGGGGGGFNRERRNSY